MCHANDKEPENILKVNICVNSVEIMKIIVLVMTKVMTKMNKVGIIAMASLRTIKMTMKISSIMDYTMRIIKLRWLKD